MAYLIPGVGGGGGAERSFASLAPHLTAQIDLHVITYTGRDHLRSDLEGAGATVDVLQPAEPVELVRRIRHRLDEVEPDLVHTTLIDADVIGRIAAVSSRVPVVTSLVNVRHGRAALSGSPVEIAKKSTLWGLDAATARSVVRFHAITNHVASVMSRRLLVQPKRVVVIARGRDPSDLGRRDAARRSSTRLALGIADDRPLVIAAARHEVQKGLDVLVKAAEILSSSRPDVQVLIGGRNGNETQRLLALLDERQLHDRVRLIGPRDDVGDLMCAADVWCVPSRWEGFGGILIEAMALEVPTVASRVPAIVEVAGDPPVFELVQPDCPADLAGGILRVLDAPEIASVRASIGRQRFLDNFTTAEVADRMLDFYNEALAASRWTRWTQR